MNILKEETYVEVTVALSCGEDYISSQLVPDLITGEYKTLDGSDLEQIAQKNGFDSCEWHGMEENGKITARFRKRKVCKCDETVGKSCDCGGKA